MHHKDPVKEVIDEMLFEEKLARYMSMSPARKRTILNCINGAEARMAKEHKETNDLILRKEMFEMEWARENPDGDWEDI